jgi:2-keto-4-pentenoate hydratase/2-oxohepta-3-ene-1,7-dioic acid hydratase in catechol pathway
VSWPWSSAGCARNVDASDALDFVFGYTIANDVTARDLQRTDGQWARAKGFDTFCPLGPWIETDLDPGCPTDRDDARRGRSSRTVRRPTWCTTSRPDRLRVRGVHVAAGDVILTGTPAGVGLVDAGQRVDVDIDGIGVLSNPFVRH